MSLEEWFYTIGIVFFLFLGTVILALLYFAYYAWQRVQQYEHELRQNLGPVADVLKVVSRPSILGPSSVALTLLPFAWKYGKKLWKK